MSDDLHLTYQHLLARTTAPRETTERVATRVRARHRRRRAGLTVAALMVVATGSGIAVATTTGPGDRIVADPMGRDAPTEQSSATRPMADPVPTATPGLLPEDVTCAGLSENTTFDFFVGPISGPQNPATSVRRFLEGALGNGAPAHGERLVEERGKRATVTRIGIIRADGTARALFLLRGGEGWRLEQASECHAGADDLGAQVPAR